MSDLTIARILAIGTLYAWTTVLVVGEKGKTAWETMSDLTIARFLAVGTLYVLTTDLLVVGEKDGENFPVRSFQRAAEEMPQPLGYCAEEDLMYCPFNYTFQLSATENITMAEIALCKSEGSICPKKINTSSLFHGCSEKEDIGCGEDEPNQCKLFGSSCLNKPLSKSYGYSVFLNCCQGRLITKTGKRIQVGAACNEKTQMCEPRFRLNTTCGEGKKDYLRCFTKTNDYDPDSPYCGYLIEPRTHLEEIKSPIVTRGNSQLTPGQGLRNEPRRCVEKKDRCGLMKPVSVLCGKQLPDRYINYPFCGCPSLDEKTAYHCVGKVCQSCKLNGVKCASNSECCIHHNCVDGKCLQCFPLTYNGEINCNPGKPYGGCCDGNLCKGLEHRFYCSDRPAVLRDPHRIGGA